MIENNNTTEQNSINDKNIASGLEDKTNAETLENLAVEKLEGIKVNGNKIEDGTDGTKRGERKELKHLVEMPHNNRTIEITRDTNFGSKNKVSKFFLTINYAIVEGILWTITKMFFGLKVEGKKNFKELKKQKKGFIVVSNHFNIMDVPLNVAAFGPHKMQFTSIEANFAIPVAGRILSYFNTVPMPDNPRKLLYVFEYCVKAVKEGSIIHFFPEGVLLPYNNNIKSFNKGAFLCAEKANCDILPIVFTQRKAKGPFKYLKKYRCSYTAHILQPESVNKQLSKKEAIADIENRVKNIMVDTINKYDENVVSKDYSEYI